MSRFAPGVIGPKAKCPVEIEVEHHASKIEQQRVGSAGGEQG
jgi:hypothetical protein